MSVEDFRQDIEWRCVFEDAYDEYVSGHAIDHVSDVYYQADGEHDETEWVAIVGWEGDEGNVAVVVASAEYSGFGGSASIEFYHSIATALTELTPSQKERLGL